jgi:hypothetical protein
MKRFEFYQVNVGELINRYTAHVVWFHVYSDGVLLSLEDNRNVYAVEPSAPP